MFKNLSFSKKWAVAILVTAALLLGVIFYMYTGIKTAKNTIDGFVLDQYPKQSSIANSRMQAMQLARDLRDYYIKYQYDEQNYNDEDLKNVQVGILLTKEKMDVISENYSDDTSLIKYHEAADKWLTIATTISEKIADGKLNEATPLLLEDCPKALNTLVEESEKLMVQIQSDIDTTLSGFTYKVHRLSIISLCILAAALIISALLSRQIRKSILIPLTEITDAAQEMSRGNLEHKLYYTSHDELGLLAESIRQCEAILKLYIYDIDKLMNELSQGNYTLITNQEYVGSFNGISLGFDLLANSMADNVMLLNSIASQLSEGSNQVAASAQSLAEGSSEQASTISIIAKNLENIAQKTIASADNATLSAKTAISVSNEISQCSDKLLKMTLAMTEINNSSAQINKITKTIEDIAFQTNILALNAAVEAARSGIAGKGFSVVANEVRNLAEKSAVASKEIASLIDNLQQSVVAGTTLANDTSDTMNKIVEHVSQVTASINLISKASIEEAELVTDITASIGEISTVVQTNAAVAQESAAASQELSGQAEILKDMVYKYKIR